MFNPQKKKGKTTMSVKYKKVINNRKNSPTKGKVYGRAVVTNVVYTKEMASKIGDRCTVTEPDILAVIAALGTEMSSQLSQGNRVVLDGFGAFKVAITTKPADTGKKFTANNITGMRILFQPAVEMDHGKRIKTMLKGVKVEELTEYNGLKDAEGDNTTDPGSTPGGSGSSSSGTDQGGSGNGDLDL